MMYKIYDILASAEHSALPTTYHTIWEDFQAPFGGIRRRETCGVHSSQYKQTVYIKRITSLVAQTLSVM